MQSDARRKRSFSMDRPDKSPQLIRVRDARAYPSSAAFREWAKRRFLQSEEKKVRILTVLLVFAARSYRYRRTILLSRQST